MNAFHFCLPSQNTMWRYLPPAFRSRTPSRPSGMLFSSSPSPRSSSCSNLPSSPSRTWNSAMNTSGTEGGRHHPIFNLRRGKIFNASARTRTHAHGWVPGMKAKFKGQCPECGSEIKTGQEISRYKDRWVHKGCAPSEEL